MDISEFNDISIRGRMAYGICCLERILARDNIRSKDWDFVLNLMWEYTSLPYDNIEDVRNLDDWDYEAAECRFGAVENRVQGGKNVHSRPYDLPDEKFTFVAKAYKNFQDIYPVAGKIFEVGLAELCGGEKYPGYATSQCLSELLVLIEKTGIEFPSIEPFKKYAFNVKTYIGSRYSDYAFGTPFDGKKEFSIYFKEQV